MVGTTFIILAFIIPLIILTSGFAVYSDNSKIQKLGELIWENVNTLNVLCIALVVIGLIFTYISGINIQVKELQEGKILSISNDALIYSINDEIKDFTKFYTKYAEIDKPKIRFDNNGVLKKVVVELPIEGITDFDVEGE